jgi:hypothetical protein
MEWAALIAWVVTAGGGFVLFSIWLARGGMRQGREPGQRIRPLLILSHFLLAGTGLVIWIVYVFSDSDALAWVASCCSSLWPGSASRCSRSGTSADSVVPCARRLTREQQHFPVSIVTLHGLLAVTTLTLVLLTGLGF